MAKLSKNRKISLEKIDAEKSYSLDEASALVKEVTTTKFDSSVDLAIRLGVDPKKANEIGLDDYIEKIKKGWVDVDVIVTMPSVMGKLGPLGKVLGPRGLMPNPKTGTVTMDIAKAVSDIKGGKIDFKVDKTGIIHASVGKVSFTADKIKDNANELIKTIIKLKPSGAKGTYIKSISMSSTMSPGIAIESKFE